MFTASRNESKWFYEKTTSLHERFQKCETVAMDIERKMFTKGHSLKLPSEIGRQRDLEEYWHKVVADGEKSKARNMKILEKLSTIDRLMHSLGGKAEKLEVLREEYINITLKLQSLGNAPPLWESSSSGKVAENQHVTKSQRWLDSVTDSGLGYSYGPSPGHALKDCCSVWTQTDDVVRCPHCYKCVYEGADHVLDREKSIDLTQNITSQAICHLESVFSDHATDINLDEEGNDKYVQNSFHLTNTKKTPYMKQKLLRDSSLSGFDHPHQLTHKCTEDLDKAVPERPNTVPGDIFDIQDTRLLTNPERNNKFVDGNANTQIHSEYPLLWQSQDNKNKSHDKGLEKEQEVNYKPDINYESEGLIRKEAQRFSEEKQHYKLASIDGYQNNVCFKEKDTERHHHYSIHEESAIKELPSTYESDAYVTEKVKSDKEYPERRDEELYENKRKGIVGFDIVDDSTHNEQYGIKSRQSEHISPLNSRSGRITSSAASNSDQLPPYLSSSLNQLTSDSDLNISYHQQLDIDNQSYDKIDPDGEETIGGFDHESPEQRNNTDTFAKKEDNHQTDEVNTLIKHKVYEESNISGYATVKNYPVSPEIDPDDQREQLVLPVFDGLNTIPSNNSPPPSNINNEEKLFETIESPELTSKIDNPKRTKHLEGKGETPTENISSLTNSDAKLMEKTQDQDVTLHKPSESIKNLNFRDSSEESSNMDDMEDSFFDNEPPMVKQSSAYRALLGIQAHHKDSDSEDDIENNFAQSVMSKKSTKENPPTSSALQSTVVSSEKQADDLTTREHEVKKPISIQERNRIKQKVLLLGQGFDSDLEDNSKGHESNHCEADDDDFFD